jgi:hypothetical protein
LLTLDLEEDIVGEEEDSNLVHGVVVVACL